MVRKVCCPGIECEWPDRLLEGAPGCSDAVRSDPVFNVLPFFSTNELRLTMIHN